MPEWCEMLHGAYLVLGRISKRSEFPVRIKPNSHLRILPPPTVPQWAATIHFLSRLISRVYILILSSPMRFWDFSTYSEPLKSSLYITAHFSWVDINLLNRSGYYTGCHRRNGPNFGRVFLMLNYTDITQNTYIQSWMVTEIMAREVWNFDSCYSLIDYQIHIETGRNMWFL